MLKKVIDCLLPTVDQTPKPQVDPRTGGLTLKMRTRQRSAPGTDDENLHWVPAEVRSLHQYSESQPGSLTLLLNKTLNQTPFTNTLIKELDKPNTHAHTHTYSYNQNS